MEEEVKSYRLTSELEMIRNAESIKISGETLDLIKCRAMLYTAYDYFLGLMMVTYPWELEKKDGIIDSFKAGYNKMDEEMMKVITKFISRNMLDSNFREM